MTVAAVVYDEEAVRSYDDLGNARAAEGTTWVRAHGAAESELHEVAEAFDVHGLAVEDVVNGVRPKTEEYEGHTFVVLKTAELARGETTFDEEIHTTAVGVFVGEDRVVTMSAGDDAPVDRVWAAVERGDERLL